MQKPRRTTWGLGGVGGVIGTVLGLEVASGDTLSNEFSIAAMGLALGGQVLAYLIESWRDRPRLAQAIRDATADGRITQDEIRNVYNVFTDEEHSE